MKKAFLSHNEADKLFVEKVAERLDRAKTIFDKYNFHEGEDFRKLILQGLQESSVFVLFASEHSINAPWVKYEFDHAERLYIDGKIKKVLIFLIGNNITHKNLPHWCQNALIVSVTNPSITARLIEESLLKINIHMEDVFIGRGTDMDKFSEHLFRKRKTPQVFVFYGLNGIGRRSFAKEILRDIYNLRMGPIFVMEPSNSILDLYVKILDDLSIVNTKISLEEYINSFRTATLQEQVNEIIRLLEEYSKHKLVPGLLDNGALLNSSGKYKKEFRLIMEKVNETDGLFLSVFQTRNPNYSDEEQFFFVTYLKPLSNDGMNALLSTYLRNINIEYDRESIIEFTNFLDGYPPAAQFVRNAIEKYGLQIALADKSLLSDFKAKSFNQYVKQMVEDNESKIKILKLCESLPALSYNVLEILIDEGEFLSNFKDLIDQSIIVVEKQNSTFSISSPLKETIRRTWGSLNKKDFSEIANILKSKYWDGENLPENSVLETLIFCLLRSDNQKDIVEFSGITLPSTIFNAAKSAYENREWSEAIDLSRKTLLLNNELDEARVILFKSLVRENENSDSVLSELKGRGYRGYYALRGFRDLKKKNYSEAIKSYDLALATGDESVVVYREIAECYYWVGDYDKATTYINFVIKRNSKPNPFVLDLAAKISIESKDFELAVNYIDLLESVDRKENVSHRRALLYSKQGNYYEALECAEIACTRQPPLPETFFNKAHILLMLRKLKEARSVLDEIQEKFKTQTKKDFYKELRVKLALEENRLEEAELYFNQLNNKSSDYAMILKYNILEMKISDRSTELYEKIKLKSELEHLKAQGIEDLIEADFQLKV